MNTENFDNSSLKYKIEHVAKHSIALSWEAREGLVEYWLTPAGENSDVPLYQGPDNNFTHSSLVTRHSSLVTRHSSLVTQVEHGIQLFFERENGGQ